MFLLFDAYYLFLYVSRGFEGMSDEAEEASSDYNSEDESDDFIVDGVKDESDDFILDDVDEDDSNDDEDESDFSMLPSSPRSRSSGMSHHLLV